MKKYYLILIAAVIVVGVYVFFASRWSSAPAPQSANNTTVRNNLNQNLSGTQNAVQPLARNAGRLILTISDAAASLSDLQSLVLTIDEIKAHSAKGWVTITQSLRAYNLLALYAQNKSELMLDSQIPEGTYDKVLLTIGGLSIATKNGTTHEAALLARSISMNTKLVVAKGKTSAVEFDFASGKSLFIADTGDYVFAPVIKLDTLSDIQNLQISPATQQVDIFGEQNDFDATMGMNETGTMVIGFSFEPITHFHVDKGTVSIIPR